jgi:hypothetical protein
VTRGLIRGTLVALLAGATLAAASAAPPADRSAPSPLLERFLSFIEPAVVEYRAFRHLEAQNDRFNSSAWMDVWTETNRDGEFSYRIVGQGGSSYIRSRVFLPALEGERQVCGSSGCDRGALTVSNYVFEDRREEKDGLAWLMVKPRRKDVVLVEGSLFLNPDDGDLVRMEGRLSKTPSMWTRRIDIVRSFRRLAGVRMPVELESVATLLVAGRSTFRMTYDYETVNGQRVGDSSKLIAR